MYTWKHTNIYNHVSVIFPFNTIQKPRANWLKQKGNVWAQLKNVEFWLVFQIIRKRQFFSLSRVLSCFLSGGSFQSSVSPHGDKMAATAFATPLYFSTSMKERKSFPDYSVDNSRCIGPGPLSLDMPPHPNKHCDLENTRFWLV